VEDKAVKKAQNKARKAQETAQRIIVGPVAPGVLKLGIPLALAMALQSTFNLIDMLIVSDLPDGKEAVAALAICDLVAMVPTILANGISNASAALIARRAGEKDERAVSFFTWQSLALVTWLSFIAGVIGIFFADTLTTDVFEAKGQMRVLTIEYMQIIVGGAFSILLLLQMCAIMRALGDGKTPLYLLVGSNVVNLFWTIVMVWGDSPAPAALSWAKPVAELFGIEAMGVAGAAWSTIGSRCVALLIGGFILARHHGAVKFRWSDLMLTKRAVTQLMKIAWPNSAQFVLRIGVVLFFAAIITRFFTTVADSSTATAYAICTRLETLILFMSMGWGAAASTYVGQNLGAGQMQRALSSGWWGSIYNLLFTGGILLAFLFFADDIIGIFNSSPSVIEVGKNYLRIVGASYLLFGVAVVLSQAMTGAGATMIGFTIDGLVLLGVVVPATLLVIALTDITQTQTWFIVATGNVLSGLAYVFYFRRGTWASKQI
jgi:putative MATE family efflux protein